VKIAARTAISISRLHHCTETAVLQVISDILEALDRGDFDLSAAFDMVDHIILTRCLETSYGICSTVLKLFQTYLEQRM